MQPVATTFHIDGSDTARPPAERTILADGADSAAERRPGDIELSHWVPNSTDARYKADTSTEICLRYVADPAHESVDLVVNDHVDIDGILSLYVLLHPRLALEHADVLIGAAEVGDFLAWADRPGFVLAQEIWRAVTSPAAAHLDPNARYELGFEVTTDLLTGKSAESPATTFGWECIERGLALLDGGAVVTRLVSEHLVSFVFPDSIDHVAVHGVPPLNQLVDERLALWPQVRNREHAQRLQILSSPAESGTWRHDLWAPGYSWAETPNRWMLPGLESSGDSNRWTVNDPVLSSAVDAMRGRESGPGSWALADSLTPFETIAGRGFPILASCVDERGQPVPSSLSPDDVLSHLGPVWTSSTVSAD